LYLVGVYDGCFVRETVDGVSGSGVIDENIIIAVVDRLCWTLVVAKAVLSILSRSLVIFGIQSSSESCLVNRVSTVLNIVLATVVYHVLLILSILHGNRLLIILLVRSVVRMNVVLLFDVSLDIVASSHGSST
jgi:hypothetical protein